MIENPCREVKAKAENKGRTRFLSDDERKRLLSSCLQSNWPKMYLLVLMALTTGARKSELLYLRRKDIDLKYRTTVSTINFRVLMKPTLEPWLSLRSTEQEKAA